MYAISLTYHRAVPLHGFRAVPGSQAHWSNGIEVAQRFCMMRLNFDNLPHTLLHPRFTNGVVVELAVEMLLFASWSLDTGTHTHNLSSPSPGLFLSVEERR